MSIERSFMSTSELGWQESEFVEPSIEPIVHNAPRPLHRIRDVRQEQGISLRRIAAQMKQDIEEVRREEQTDTDLPLSRLYAWQRLLDVPVADLLVDCDAPLSAPVLQRARMVRLMKTVAAIQEKAGTTAVRRLATTLAEQLIEIMPELEGVTAWNSVGEKRHLTDLGRAARPMLPGDYRGD